MVAGGTGADSTVDLNSIPFAAVDRIEVLADGASAIYGSDAIAGVVNVITRKGFAGTGATAQYGVSSHGDGQTWDINVNTGVSGDTGSVFFGLGYFNQEQIMAGNRDWSEYALTYDYTDGSTFKGGSGTIPNGRFNISRDPAAGETQFVTDLRGAYPGKTSFIWQPAGTAGTTCTTVDGKQSCWRPYVSSGTPNDTYNFSAVNYLVTPSQRVSLFTAGDTKLGTDKYAPRFYFNGLYTNRQSSQELAPVPLALANFDGVTISPQNPYNPTGQTIFAANMRMNQLGGRHFSQDIDTFQAVIGLDGKLPLQTWIWDTNLNFGRVNAVSTQTGSLVLSKLNAAMGPGFKDASGVYRCGTVDAPINGCTPFNMFNGPTGNSPEALNAISFDGTNRGWNQMLDWQVNFSGQVFQLPTTKRPIQLAIGNELMKNWGGFIPNPIAGSNDSSDSNSLATSGDYLTNQTYAELSIPIVSDEFLLNDLEVNLAGRYSWYNTFGSNFSYMLGGKYRPIRDVTLRGTYGTGFRAPNIGNLYGGAAESFPSVSDPCAGPFPPGTPIPPNCGVYANNGDTATQLKETLGGNPNLQPETSKNWTVGVVFEPTFVKNLSATVDYWSYDVQNAIGVVGASVILNSCYSASGKFCNQIQRNPNTGYISLIDDRNVNVGSDQTAGLDIAAHYMLPTDIGRWDFGALATWTNYFNRTYADGSTLNAVGTYDLGMYPAWKGNVNVGWNWDAFSANVRWRFVSGFRECSDGAGSSAGGLCFQNELAATEYRDVSFYSVTDLFVSYTLSTTIGKTLFGFGMNNVFNQKPAVIYSAFANQADPSMYDWVGQYFYFRLGQSI
jgi:outer membrane receptor protein involved in Fe transport